MFSFLFHLIIIFASRFSIKSGTMPTNRPKDRIVGSGGKRMRVNV